MKILPIISLLLGILVFSFVFTEESKIMQLVYSLIGISAVSAAVFNFYQNKKHV